MDLARVSDILNDIKKYIIEEASRPENKQQCEEIQYQVSKRHAEITKFLDDKLTVVLESNIETDIGLFCADYMSSLTVLLSLSTLSLDVEQIDSTIESMKNHMTKILAA